MRLHQADRGRENAAAARAGWLAALACSCLALSTATAAPRGSLVAHEALERCTAADSEPDEMCDRDLREGIRLAEEALAADADDAAAHFALFCNLGKQMKRGGMGPQVVLDVRRLRHAIDRALELAPTDADVLAGKGALLLTLPSFFGGDPAEAQRLLIRAFIADPENPIARLYLEKALE